MQYLPLGQTGLTVSEVGFGGIPIIRLSSDDAQRVVRRAFDRGMTFFDTANAYHDSEDKIGRALEGHRDEVVLASKTMRRTPAEALEQLEQSLRMLRTDHLDLYQPHQVSQEADWEALTRPGGIADTLLAAKEQGKIRVLGVTSHSLDMALRLVESGLFGTIQFPFNFIETDAAERLHPAARERGLGIVVMKPFAGGVITSADQAFRFLRQYPDAIPIPGLDSVAGVDEVTGFYGQPNQVSESDRAEWARVAAEVGSEFCRRCEYCQPCPNGVLITTAMGYPIVASRMSHEVAVNFARRAMDTVPECVACGDCLPRCPYELAIPDIMQRNYALYQEHCAQVGG